VVTENDVGPEAGVAENGVRHRFVLIRPKDMAQGGLCHPVITWGNGYGDNPPTYMVLLKQLASHGFVVVASLSHYVSQTPDGGAPPMKVGVDWVLQQNEDPQSALYGRIDTTHVGATGHSAGGLATSQLGSDPRVGAIATLCGAGANAGLHGPALLLCGGQDTVATCSRMQSAFDGITNQPVMLADQLSATHGSWIGSIKDPFMIAVTGWMRLHLMGDTALRGMFYGADCTLCKNTSVWKVQRKMMDQ
jgi:dienelactone hydrolase